MKVVQLLIVIMFYPFLGYGQIDVSFVDSVSFSTQVETEYPSPSIYFFYSGDTIVGVDSASLSPQAIMSGKAVELIMDQLDSNSLRPFLELAKYQPRRLESTSFLPLYAVWHKESELQLLTIRFVTQRFGKSQDYLITFESVSASFRPKFLSKSNNINYLLGLLAEEGLANIISPHSSGVYEKMGSPYFRPYPEAGINLEAILKYYNSLSSDEKEDWLAETNKKVE